MVWSAVPASRILLLLLLRSMSSASIYRRVENSALDNGKEEEEGFCAGKRTCFCCSSPVVFVVVVFGLKVGNREHWLTDTPVDGYRFSSSSQETAALHDRMGWRRLCVFFTSKHTLSPTDFDLLECCLMFMRRMFELFEFFLMLCFLSF